MADFPNVIAFQFTIAPIDVLTKLSRVKFDTSRQSKILSGTIGADGTITRYAVNDPERNHDFPVQWEKANDDSGNAVDEGNVMSNGHMYNIDAPAPTMLDESPPATLSAYVFKYNMYEFVRVAFKGIRPEGNEIKGSQSSANSLWHAIITVKPVGGHWKRTEAANSNEIDEALTEIPNLPTNP